MKTKGLIWAATIALSAAAAPATAALTKEQAGFSNAYTGFLCVDATKCTVKVKVAAGCRFTVTPWTLGLKRGHGNVKIHWIIDKDSPAEFDKEKGISFKAPDSGKEFTDPAWVSPKEFRWNDKNEAGTPQARPHNYAIKVKLGNDTCTLDPTIVNDY